MADEDARFVDVAQVKGIFDAGYYEFNDLFVLCSLANAQDMYELEDAAHGLIVMLDDPNGRTKRANSFVRRWAAVFTSQRGWRTVR